ncbi:T9SS type A sorting domain-containing protein [Flavobacterium caeni]|uniref:Por secretion system C-terminal sorting domain-containing protein n=1 Tax=Flavobacterium caeni TaxID=490189 RepID=A0A1G5FF14_9FLAO|nr:T9SS type A sorting domain-containing protein [Flavobacterium caeni]SCY37836.1 Por secretion system C-terminal sorting domain-containing protein [Flavobacterium caeni]
MKRGLLLLTAILTGFTAQAQVVNASISMGSGYANQVYYKLPTQANNEYPHASWDVAFLRTSAFAFGTRINDARNIEVYDASSNIADWATIDVTQIANWTRLYNSETQWDLGAFDQGSATYGWGEYNPGNHHVTGAVVFVLKYANGTFRKFKIDDFFGGYTFTYATWDGSAWGADQQVVLPNATNPTNRFNYYSLENATAVVAEPATTDWDITFTKYKTDYFGDGSFWQDVTGVFHAPNVQVAENIEPAGMPDPLLGGGLTYVEDINQIGYDWKTFNQATFTYSIATDKAFYVKLPNNTVYRLAFNSFAGSSTGNITFNHQDVTSLLATETFGNNNAFGVYPNPTVDKKINIVYDLATAGAQNTVSVYSITGAKVFEQTLESATGFFNQSIDLGQLNNGVYVLKFQSGDYTATRKIVLQ